MAVVFDEIYSLVEELDMDIFTKHRIEQMKFIYKARWITLRNSRAVLSFYGIVAICLMFAPIMDSEEKKLPVLSWYPFDVTTPPYRFIFVYIYECIGNKNANTFFDKNVTAENKNSDTLRYLQNQLFKLNKNSEKKNIYQNPSVFLF